MKSYFHNCYRSKNKLEYSQTRVSMIRIKYLCRFRCQPAVVVPITDCSTFLFLLISSNCSFGISISVVEQESA